MLVFRWLLNVFRWLHLAVNNFIHSSLARGWQSSPLRFSYIFVHHLRFFVIFGNLFEYKLQFHLIASTEESQLFSHMQVSREVFCAFLFYLWHFFLFIKYDSNVKLLGLRQYMSRLLKRITYPKPKYASNQQNLVADVLYYASIPHEFDKDMCCCCSNGLLANDAIYWIWINIIYSRYFDAHTFQPDNYAKWPVLFSIVFSS